MTQNISRIPRDPYVCMVSQTYYTGQIPPSTYVIDITDKREAERLEGREKTVDGITNEFLHGGG